MVPTDSVLKKLWFNFCVLKMNGFYFNIQYRQDLQDYQDIFGLVLQYPVHPVDPNKKDRA